MHAVSVALMDPGLPPALRTSHFLVGSLPKLVGCGGGWQRSAGLPPALQLLWQGYSRHLLSVFKKGGRRRHSSASPLGVEEPVDTPRGACCEWCLTPPLGGTGIAYSSVMQL